MQIIYDQINDPSNITPEVWEAISNWVNTVEVNSWLEEQLVEGKRVSYGLVYDVVETISQRGVKRIEIKYMSKAGTAGFVWSTRSGGTEVERLRLQQPDGFKIGDVVMSEEEGNQILQRIKITDPIEAMKQKLILLA